MSNKLNILSEKKEELNRLKPFPSELLQSLEDWIKVELTYSSNALSGNSLTRDETAEVIKKNK